MKKVVNFFKEHWKELVIHTAVPFGTGVAGWVFGSFVIGALVGFAFMFGREVDQEQQKLVRADVTGKTKLKDVWNKKLDPRTWSVGNRVDALGALSVVVIGVLF